MVRKESTGHYACLYMIEEALKGFKNGIQVFVMPSAMLAGSVVKLRLFMKKEVMFTDYRNVQNLDAEKAGITKKLMIQELP